MCERDRVCVRERACRGLGTSCGLAVRSQDEVVHWSTTLPTTPQGYFGV